MAKDSRGPANDPMSMLQRQIEVLSDRIRRLERQRVLTSQLYIPDDVPDPLEGEHIIDPSDDKHAWYSNGAWHKAGSRQPFRPRGIIRNNEIAPPPWTSGGPYFDWGDDPFVTNDTALHEIPPGPDTQTIPSGSDWNGYAFSTDKANSPHVAWYFETPGIYITSLTINFSRGALSPPSSPFTNYIEWAPGGQAAGQGGAGQMAYIAEYHDPSFAPGGTQYAHAGDYFMTLGVSYVSEMLDFPVAGLQFKAHSTASYDSIDFAGSCWMIGEWSEADA